MENLKTHLFYSPTEKFAFYVAGYTDNSENVSEITDMLISKAGKFSEAVCVSPEEVKTFFVSKSLRYKQMRVFYASTEKAPKDAFDIGEDWTMSKWIAN